MPKNLYFETRFEALTGHGPFPWQVALYEEFSRGRFPEACDIPTGLGKTSIIPIWLIALADRGAEMPRRLVYVVNRRTVVDQATDEAVRIRMKILGHEDGDPSPQFVEARRGLSESLRGLAASAESGSLAISTLRGKFADNREWSADPSRPAIIVGTVDMIGSRLLFGGYGLGFKTRPLHAGFLGIDALIVHDEAHLEPAFQKLIMAIPKEQDREFAKRPDPLGESMRLKVMSLTATPRGGEPFKLTDEDRAHPEVKKRIEAKKLVVLHSFGEYHSKDKLAEKLAELALAHKDASRTVLVFARAVEVVEKVAEKLFKAKLKPRVLTGTMRGKERDELIEDPVFRRFLPATRSGKETAYLVCTSAGEVGVNLSADHLVCDLSTFESMAQRFGRVNRFGERDDTKIDIVYPEKFDEKDPIKPRLEKTLALLIQLEGNGSPDALDDLDRRNPGACLDAFSPDPKMLETSDILFDAWSMTTIRDALPGRPILEPYLHGVTEDELPQIQVAWREEVRWLSGPSWKDEERVEFFEGYPLKPHELLRDRSDRIFRHIEELSKHHPEESVWLIDQSGRVESLLSDEAEKERSLTLKDLADKDRKHRINVRTILLSPKAGGLSNGLLDGKSAEGVGDVSEHLTSAGEQPQRKRIWDEQEPPVGMRLIRTIDTRPGIDGMEATPDDEPTSVGDESGEEAEEGQADRKWSRGRFWHWYELPEVADGEGSECAKRSVLWQGHTDDVVRNAKAIVEHLPLLAWIKTAVILAALHHDLGKKRPVFQRRIGNRDATLFLAKSGKKKRPFDVGEKYRHEFGSLLDFERQVKCEGLDQEQMELVKHLIATHHGRGRPHFPTDEAFDPGHPKSEVDRAASEVSRRFAGLQRRYGRWGLAYLESLLRAADYAASAKPDRTSLLEDQP